MCASVQFPPWHTRGRGCGSPRRGEMTSTACHWPLRSAAPAGEAVRQRAPERDAGLGPEEGPDPGLPGAGLPHLASDRADVLVQADGLLSGGAFGAVVARLLEGCRHASHRRGVLVVEVALGDVAL